MKILYSFDEYIKECYSTVIESEVRSLAYAGIFESSYLTTKEKIWLKNFLFESETQENTLNEAFIDKIKDSIERARTKSSQAINVIGKETLEKLERLATNAQKFVEYLIDKLEELWKYAIDTYDKTKEKTKKEIKDAITKNKKVLEDHRKTIGEGLKEDMRLFKETCNWWVKDFSSIFIGAMREQLKSLFISESLNSADVINMLSNFNEEELNEGGKFGWVSKIVHTLSKVPPFSILGDIREKATQAFGYFLENISEFTNKLGGPGVYNLTALSIILGVLAEVTVKKISVGVALSVIPFAGTILGILGYVAYGLLIIEVLEELTSTGSFFSEVDLKGEI